MSLPYTLFTSAADNLVSEYRMRHSGTINPEKPIVPIMVILIATIEEFAAVSSPVKFQETSPALILSHFEDKDGPVTEFGNQRFTIKAPPALLQFQVSAGDRVMIQVTMTIKSHAMADCSEWPIRYHLSDGEYCLAFREILFLKKI